MHIYNTIKNLQLKNYTIVYVIYDADKKVEILGILHKSGKIMHGKNIKKDTVLDKVLTKVCDKLLKNKLKNIKKTLVKLEYMRNPKNDTIILDGKVLGKMDTKGKIIFN